MPWSTPITWVTGDLVTSGRLNTMVSDNQNYLHGNGADGFANMRMSGLVPALLPNENGDAVFGTVIWDATGYLSTWQATTGDLPPWGYVPEPSGYNLLIARVNTITGGTLSNQAWFNSESGDVPDLTAGTVPITGYQTTIMALHKYNAVKMKVSASHGGVAGTAQSLAVVLELAQLMGL